MILVVVNEPRGEQYGGARRAGLSRSSEGVTALLGVAHPLGFRGGGSR